MNVGGEDNELDRLHFPADTSVLILSVAKFPALYKRLDPAEPIIRGDKQC